MTVMMRRPAARQPSIPGRRAGHREKNKQGERARVVRGQRKKKHRKKKQTSQRVEKGKKKQRKKVLTTQQVEMGVEKGKKKQRKKLQMGVPEGRETRRAVECQGWQKQPWPLAPTTALKTN
jgi:hypothetical protein